MRSGGETWTINALTIYTDYLLSSFAATPATGMKELLDNTISHDQVSRMLNGIKREPKEWWQMVNSAYSHHAR